MKEQLRLKNIVQFKQYPNEYWVVEELLMGNLTLSDSENNFSFEKNVSYDEIEGVPLTEEWLKRFGFVLFDGFKKNKYKPIVYTKDTKYSTVVVEASGRWVGLYFKEEKDIPVPTREKTSKTMDTKEQQVNFAWDVKTVHRLQNIWHSITGE